MHNIILKILERANVLILILGIFLVIAGASKGLTFGKFSFLIAENSWRLFTSSLGVLFLAVFFILLFKGDTPERRKGRGGNRSFIGQWDRQAFHDRFELAQEICMISVSNYGLLNSDLTGAFKKILQNGGKYRCIYLNPECDALSMVAFRSTDIEQDINHLKDQYRMTINTLRQFAKLRVHKENVQVRLTDYLNGYVLTILDSKLPNAVAYITVNGFGHHYSERPSLTIYKEHDPERFKFFEETFENLWDSSEKDEVEI
ncbi:MAG: hypothetical protein SD837_22505 [Candidatus Electrothrix scaldis]|nr:MAG: hypothetical protein SD837_22505 [Candidatus Electrothrix sp. GW3-3]